MPMPPVMDWFLEGRSPERLAEAAGLALGKGREAVQTLVPLLTAAVLEHARTPEGQRQIDEAVKIIPRFAAVGAALDSGLGAADLLRAGDSMAPTLLAQRREEIVQRVAQQLDSDSRSVRKLLDMALTLILGRIGQQGLSGAALVPWLMGNEPIQTKSAGIPITVPQSAPSVESTPTPSQERRGLPWWLMILPLLLLGGCLYSLRMQPKSPSLQPSLQVPPAPVQPTPAQPGAVTVTTPALGSEVPASGFTLEGTGPAGQTILIKRGAQTLSMVTVDLAGRWKANIQDAGPAGAVEYLMSTADSKHTARHALKLLGKPATTPFAITEPQPGAQMPGAGFNLKGTGQPGASYELFESGTSLGTFKVGPDGHWTVDVPGTAPKTYVYDILDSAGKRLASLPIVVKAGSSKAQCQRALTISLNDGEQVRAPFRFGGLGKAKRYVVTVWRGERQVGRKVVARRGDCAWDYRSDPGGKPGQVAQIRYEVRADDGAADPTVKKINLKVSGSGTNFKNGRYVGR